MRPSRSVSPLSCRSAVAVLGVVGALGGGLLVGCQAAPKPVPVAPSAPAVPTQQDQMSAQQRFTAVDPNVKVGRVAAVDASAHMAAVEGIAPTDLKVGDTISFTGPDYQPFANGSVKVMSPSNNGNQFPIVDYSKSPSGGRDPVVGDLAITVPLGK